MAKRKNSSEHDPTTGKIIVECIKRYIDQDVDKRFANSQYGAAVRQALLDNYNNILASNPDDNDYPEEPDAPEEPVKPDRSQYSDIKGYKDACRTYRQACKEYKDACEEYEDAYETYEYEQEDVDNVFDACRYGLNLDDSHVESFDTPEEHLAYKHGRWFARHIDAFLNPMLRIK